MRSLRFFLLFSAFVAGAYFLAFRTPSPSRAQSAGGSPTGSCCATEAPREVDFPYYNLTNGWVSTLYLVSDSPKPMDFTPAVKGRQSQVLLTPETIQPGQKLSIDLASLITQQGGDPTGPFAEGSVAIYFVGTIMPIVGQITASNPQLSLVHESVMVEHDPGRSDIPAVLNGLWWGLGGGRVASVMVSNTGTNTQTAQVYLDFQGQRHPLKDPLAFAPYETKVLDVTQLLTSIGVDPAQAPEGGITIVPTGATPTLIANGRITDPASGFSTTIDFPSPDLEIASALHASGVPIGTPSNDSPFAGAGNFVPHVVVRNLLGSAQTVTVTLEYPQVATGSGPTPAPLDPVAAQDGTHSPAAMQSPVAPITVPPYSTQDISLAALMGQFPSALPFGSVRIQFSGPPGSLQAEVTSVESKGNLVIDSHIQNEGNGWAGSGANPWHLDDDTESILFLTNESDQPAHFGFKVTANGSAPYYLTKLQLNPHETRAIDIRKLRDAEQPDFKGNLIPASATDGSVTWVRNDNLAVMGRLMQIHRKQGMASNYDCCICLCPLQYICGLGYNAPSSPQTVVGGQVPMTYYGGFENCNFTQFFYNENGSTTWSSGAPSIATVGQWAGIVTGVSGGTASITSQYVNGYTYTWQQHPIPECLATPVICPISSPANVDTLVFSITSGGVQTDSAGVVSGTSFNLRIQAKTPSGIVPDPNFNAQNLPFSLVGENTSVGESAPSAVTFNSGTANASLKLVEASLLTTSWREVYVVSNDPTTTFFPYVYVSVTATLEGLVGHTTACGYVIPQNGQFVTLPYSPGLCGQQVVATKGALAQQAPVEDVGPWCPNTPGQGNSNTCSCTSDPYWLGTGVPKAVTLERSCNSNGSGMDLGNGTASSLGISGMGGVTWKFP